MIATSPGQFVSIASILEDLCDGVCQPHTAPRGVNESLWAHFNPSSLHLPQVSSWQGQVKRAESGWGGGADGWLSLRERNLAGDRERRWTVGRQSLPEGRSGCPREPKAVVKGSWGKRSAQGCGCWWRVRIRVCLVLPENTPAAEPARWHPY